MTELGSNIEPASPKSTKKPPIGMPKTIRIILEDSDEIPPNGLFLQLNGKPYILRSGVEADVPPGILDILDHAIVSRPVKEPQTQRVIGYRDGLRFSYRIVNRRGDDEE